MQEDVIKILVTKAKIFERPFKKFFEKICGNLRKNCKNLRNNLCKCLQKFVRTFGDFVNFSEKFVETLGKICEHF